MKLEDLRIKIFADGADLTSIRQRAALPYIKGFTTNPTLMRKAGVEDYERWAKCVLDSTDKPVCFEVLSDDFAEMERQARKIASWDIYKVYVKIPITNTRGESTDKVIRSLGRDGIKLNITAITTLEQLMMATQALSAFKPSIASVFAGRMSDTGCSPEHLMFKAHTLFKEANKLNIYLLWASTREVYNIIQAELAGCDIITVPDKILDKLDLLGKDLEQVSLDTVKQFHDDAVAAGYTL